MLKKIGEALFIVLLFWVGWIFIGSNPTDRMERACTSVSGPGHFIASLLSAVNTDWGGPMQTWTDNGAYRCQLTLWNYFYAEEWKKAHPGQPLPGDQGGSTYPTQPIQKKPEQNVIPTPPSSPLGSNPPMGILVQPQSDQQAPQVVSP